MPGAVTVVGITMSFIVKNIWRYVGERVSFPLAVTFLDGSTYQNKEGEPSFRVIYKKRKAYLRSVLFGGTGVAESYILGELDIDGDITQLVLAGDEVHSKGILKRNILNTIRNRWHELRFSNSSIVQAKKNAKFHYNRGTEMFRLYLDKTMTYTCAYWSDSTRNIDEAEQNKIDHSLKKLRLEPGMTMVDVGGGWGSVLLDAYEKYGVIGTNVSPTPDQNAAMRKEIKRRGLEGKIHIQEVDFREDTEKYDRYLSLGVYEHAGYGQLEAWIKAMADSLKPGGLGLLHFIGTIQRDLEETGIFIRKWVFPGGYLPGLGETIELMDKYELEILDIENLRRHYNKTLLAWAHNFDKNWETIQALEPELYNEQFRRQWRFYLYSCAAVFVMENAKVGLFQIVFSKGRTKSYPMTREFLYEDTSRNFTKPTQSPSEMDSSIL